MAEIAIGSTDAAEVVTRSFPEGAGTLDVIGIYEVEGSKIARAWFKRGEPMLDGR